MLPMFLNQLSVIKARITTPGNGVWIADLDVDLDVSGVVPVGPAILTIGSTLMKGTIDDRASGKFGTPATHAHVQLVGGGGGWDTIVPALHLHNDFGVLSSAVYSVTGASVGEVVVDAIPKPLGKDFVRCAGPASRVFAGVEWYVNPQGVTIVGPRVPIPFNPLTADILEWDPLTKRAVLASDELVLPGTVLLDLRFGTAIVRDVEQTFGPEGTRAVCWCDVSTLPSVVPGAPKETAGTRLARAIGAHARESAGVSFLKRYRYRIALQGGDKRLTLQNVDLESTAPLFLQMIEVWPGLCGASTMFVPGTVVVVEFLDGVPPRPVVVGFDVGAPPPLETKIEAVRIALGSVAAEPVAKAPGVVSALTAIATELGLIATAMTQLAAVPVIAAVSPAAAACGAAATGAGTAAAAIAAAEPQIPSPKTFTD